MARKGVRACQAIAIGVVALGMMAGCAGSSPTGSSPSNSSVASSSPTVSAPASSAAGASGAPASAPQPTLVPFFEKLKANGSSTHFDLSKVFPGATCTVAVTVAQDASQPWKTVTFTQRDFSQDLRPKIADRGGIVSWDVQNPPDLLSNAPAGTWSSDCRLYDRNQRDFLVYRQTSSLSFGSLPPTSSTPPPASTHSPPGSTGSSRSSSPSP